MFSLASSAATDFQQNYAKVNKPGSNPKRRKRPNRIHEKRQSRGKDMAPSLGTVDEDTSETGHALTVSSASSDVSRPRLRKSASALMAAPARAIGNIFLYNRKNRRRSLFTKASDPMFPHRQGLSRQLSNESLFSMPSLATIHRNDFGLENCSEIESVLSEETSLSVLDFECNPDLDRFFPFTVVQADDFGMNLMEALPLEPTLRQEGTYIVSESNTSWSL